MNGVRVFKTLREGTSEHEMVKVLQNALGITEDGGYGPKTTKAVFQRQANYRMRTDGVAGPDTLSHLEIWSPVVHGIDVSHHQGDIDWDKLAKAKIVFDGVEHPISFVYIRTSYGAFSDKPENGPGNRCWDRKVERNMKGAIDRVPETGWRIGPYHAAYGTHTPEEEANNFYSAIEPFEKYLTMPPQLDVEGEPGVKGFKSTGQAALDWIDQWVNATMMKLGIWIPKTISIYTSTRIAKLYSFPNEIGEYPTWTAKYGQQRNPMKPWDTWDIWQYTEKGVLSGITENTVDLNVLALDSITGSHFKMTDPYMSFPHS